MSYLLSTKCQICEKKDRCTDRHFIEDAISDRNQIYPLGKGHLGKGIIELKCQNYNESLV